jgi:hypothetical protein
MDRIKQKDSSSTVFSRDKEVNSSTKNLSIPSKTKQFLDRSQETGSGGLNQVTFPAMTESDPEGLRYHCQGEKLFRWDIISFS